VPFLVVARLAVPFLVAPPPAEPLTP